MKQQIFKKSRYLDFFSEGELHRLRFKDTGLRVRHNTVYADKPDSYDAVYNWRVQRGYHPCYFTYSDKGYTGFTYKGISIYVIEYTPGVWRVTETSSGCRIGQNYSDPLTALKEFVSLIKNKYVLAVNQMCVFKDVDSDVRIQLFELMGYLNF